MSVPVAVLASGEGTTTEAFIRACVMQHLEPQVVLVICNKKDAGIFARIANLNDELGLQVEARLLNGQTHPAGPNELVTPGSQSVAEEKAIQQLLHEHNIEVVLLLGYGRRVGPELVHEYGWRADYVSPYQARMLNTHPGLLPETQGLMGIHVEEYVLEKGLAFSGPTLHVVAEDYDDGPVVAEHKVPVEPNDTAESLYARVQAVEKQNLPLDVESFILARKKYLQH